MPEVFHCEIILYVEDQARSRQFYAATLHVEPTLDVPGMTEFVIAGATLGLMPTTGIRTLLGDGIGLVSSSEIPRCELYLHVEDPDVYAARAIAAGARLLSPLTIRDWGDEVLYLFDPDSHVIAFARKTDRE